MSSWTISHLLHIISVLREYLQTTVFETSAVAKYINCIEKQVICNRLEKNTNPSNTTCFIALSSLSIYKSSESFPRVKEAHKPYESMGSWWFFSTHLKNMRQSKWLHLPQFSRWKMNRIDFSMGNGSGPTEVGSWGSLWFMIIPLFHPKTTILGPFLALLNWGSPTFTSANFASTSSLGQGFGIAASCLVFLSWMNNPWTRGGGVWWDFLGEFKWTNYI